MNLPKLLRYSAVSAISTTVSLSTLAVSTATQWATLSGLGVGGRTLVAEVTNGATFGSLWVAQYLILDWVLFRARPGRGDEGGPRRLPDPTGTARTDAVESNQFDLQAA